MDENACVRASHRKTPSPASEVFRPIPVPPTPARGACFTLGMPRGTPTENTLGSCDAKTEVVSIKQCGLGWNLDSTPSRSTRSTRNQPRQVQDSIRCIVLRAARHAARARARSGCQTRRVREPSPVSAAVRASHGAAAHCSAEPQWPATGPSQIGRLPDQATPKQRRPAPAPQRYPIRGTGRRCRPDLPATCTVHTHQRETDHPAFALSPWKIRHSNSQVISRTNSYPS